MDADHPGPPSATPVTPTDGMLPGFANLEVTVTGTTARIELARPGSLNSLTVPTLAELEQAAVAIDGYPDVKVVVVAGQGRAFCAGADLGSFATATGATAGDARSARHQGWRTAQALERMRAVTVARIQGWCVGGGVVLASSCDLRVAADDARFAIPEVDLGIPLAWGGIPRLVREVGPAVTKDLVMTCRTVTASEALAVGLVNRVVPAADLDATVDELVATLDAKTSLALLATKAHVNAVAEGMVHTQASWGDGELLAAGLRDPEGDAARHRYLEELLARRASQGQE